MTEGIFKYDERNEELHAYIPIGGRMVFHCSRLRLGEIVEGWLSLCNLYSI